MHTLTITTDDSEEIVRVRIKETDPSAATVAILQAIDKLEKPKPPRKTRSDAGKSRPPSEDDVRIVTHKGQPVMAINGVPQIVPTPAEMEAVKA